MFFDDKISRILNAFIQMMLPRHFARRPILYCKTNFCISPCNCESEHFQHSWIFIFWVHSADNLFWADWGPSPLRRRSCCGVVCHVQWAEVVLDSFMDFIVKNGSLMEVGGYFGQMLRASEHLFYFVVLAPVNDGCWICKMMFLFEKIIGKKIYHRYF